LYAVKLYYKTTPLRLRIVRTSLRSMGRARRRASWAWAGTKQRSEGMTRN
jgi:hypothetical protein